MADYESCGRRHHAYTQEPKCRSGCFDPVAQWLGSTQARQADRRRGVGPAGLHVLRPGIARSCTQQIHLKTSTAKSYGGPKWSAFSPMRMQLPAFGGAILPEQDDEWAVQRSRYMTLESVAQTGDDSPPRCRLWQHDQPGSSRKPPSLRRRTYTMR